MPFITEEIWHLIRERKEKDCVITAEWPKIKAFDSNLPKNVGKIFLLITQIRNYRGLKQMSPKIPLKLLFEKPVDEVRDLDRYFPLLKDIIRKMANVSEITNIEKEESLHSVLITDNYKFFIKTEGVVDKDKEREILTKDLEYNKGFLKSVQSKLTNERFVSNAKPEILAIEKKKQADTEAKIKAIEEQLMSLK